MTEIDNPPTWVSFSRESPRADIRVRRMCNRCYGSQVSIYEVADYEAVSPRGTVHKVRSENLTDCGIEFGPTWWRP